MAAGRRICRACVLMKFVASVAYRRRAVVQAPGIGQTVPSSGRYLHIKDALDLAPLEQSLTGGSLQLPAAHL